MRTTCACTATHDPHTEDPQTDNPRTHDPHTDNTSTHNPHTSDPLMHKPFTNDSSTHNPRMHSGRVLAFGVNVVFLVFVNLVQFMGIPEEV